MQTEIEKLPELVEAILFVAGQGVELKDIAEKLEVEVKQISKAIEELKLKHTNDGINIITYKNSAQMCSNSIYADDIAVVLNPIREKQLTKAALETLAIIAYKQPITKLEIEQVRNVNSDYAMQVLTNFKLVEVVGRKDAVGKPLLYGTTEEFLKHFNLQDINDLPDYDEILERIEIIHAEETKGDSLYGSTEIIPEEQLADTKQKETDSNNELEQNNLKNNNSENDEKFDNVISINPSNNIEDNSVKENEISEAKTDSCNPDQTVLEKNINNQISVNNQTNNSSEVENVSLENNNNLLEDNFKKTINSEEQEINNLQKENDLELENIKNTLLNSNTEDEDAIIDSFKDSDIL